VIAAIVLAAGQATRFGGPKQLALVGGRPLVQHAVDAAHDGGVDEIVVVLGAFADEIESRLELPANARIERNPAFAEGQSTSLRAGIRAAPAGAEAVVVLLADQPGVTAAEVRAVIRTFEQSGGPAVRASYRGTPGHPILLARSLFPEVLAGGGDEGAREVLRRLGGVVREIAVDRDPPRDVDTREDLSSLGDDVSPPGALG
jgi:CTP:molybdopterin cytidylyltransferase MocA